MTRYRFDLADPKDDAGLRRVLACTPMPGEVTLTLEREPNYFDACCVHGQRHQTVVCRDTQRNEIVGLATRSVRDLYVARQRQPIGYLGGLRIIPRARNVGLLARGYQFVRQLHQADPDPPKMYLTTIAEGNEAAIGPLTSGRAGLPTYHRLSRLHTLVLPIRKGRRSLGSGSAVTCQAARDGERDCLIEFLNRYGRDKTFFPVYDSSDIGNQGAGNPGATFRDLKSSQIVVARRQGKIVGVAGMWDQRTFRQSRVRGYTRMIGSLRPLINQWARMTGGIPLPKVGDPLPACFVCFPNIPDGDPEVFDAIIGRLMQLAPADVLCLLLGLCDDDPLLPHASRLSRWTYTTRLYGVSWDSLPSAVTTTCSRPHYLELGCL